MAEMDGFSYSRPIVIDDSSLLRPKTDKKTDAHGL